MTWEKIWDAWEAGDRQAVRRLLDSAFQGSRPRQSSILEFAKEAGE